jgi:hypothetical protein
MADNNNYEKIEQSFASLFPSDYQITVQKCSKAKVFIFHGKPLKFNHNILIVMNMVGKILYQKSGAYEPLYIDEIQTRPIDKSSIQQHQPYLFDRDEIFCIVSEKILIHIEDEQVKEYQYDDYVGTHIFKLDNIIVSWTVDVDPLTYTSQPGNYCKKLTIYFNWKEIFCFNINCQYVAKLHLIEKVYDNLYLCCVSGYKQNTIIIIDIATKKIINEFPYQSQYIIEENGATFIDIANKNIITFGKKEAKPGKDCVICFTNLTKTAKYCITSCGHSSFCECINSLQDKKCPICRKNIDNIIKLYD